MNLKEAMNVHEVHARKLQDDIRDIDCTLKHAGNWGPTDKSFDEFIIRLRDSSSISVKVLLSTRDELASMIEEVHTSERHVVVETGEKVKFTDCVERAAKLVDDCEDLKDAIAAIGNYSPNSVATYEEFLIEMRESKRCSVELLISSLVLLEEELRIWLESEVS